jgi:hypothetical protein
LIENKNPKSIIFGALDESEGRKKLYWSFSNELEKKYNYKLSTNAKNGNQAFILYKEDIDKDILMNTFEKIVEDIF